MEQVVMPKAGMAMEVGTIIKWLKDVGDHVEYGEPLLEIETDKTSMQVESMSTGYLLAKLYDAGDEVPVVTTIGWIGEQGEQVPESSQSAPSAPSAPAPEQKSAKRYDIVVLGSGPAGYVGAIRAAQKGAKTAIVEERELGGTCLNRGCIPTKTYLRSAEMLGALTELAVRGISLDSTAFHVDMPKAVDQKNGVVHTLVRGVGALMKSNGIDVYTQHGELAPDHRVVLADGTSLEADHVLFAGGSEVARVPIPGADCPAVVTSDEILDLQYVPGKLVVIGGGVIGVEIASVFSAFGSQVTILEMMPHILPNTDTECSDVLRKALTARGIDIHTGVRVQSISQSGDLATVTCADGTSYDANVILMCVGRKPNLSGLGTSGVKTDERGRVLVDDHMRTNVDWIYAPGDINGTCMLAHAASAMAENAVENALGGSVPYSGAVVPACVYTTPEVAFVGKSEEEAKKTHRNVRVGKFPFSANGRALASGEGTGFVKSIVDADTGEILGIHIVGPNAAEMINEASALMAMEITAHELEDIVHAHPTFSEALKESIEDALGTSVHLPRRK